MHENAPKFERKTRRKFPATILSYSMVKIVHLDNAGSTTSFSLQGAVRRETLGTRSLEAIPVEGRSLQRKDKKRKKRKG